MFRGGFLRQNNENVNIDIRDFYILEKHTMRVIIGTNQIDLWSGWSTNKQGVNI